MIVRIVIALAGLYSCIHGVVDSVLNAPLYYLIKLMYKCLID